MMLNLLSVVSSDKYIEHPILGSMSCSGLFEAYKRCTELLSSSGALPIQCRSLHDKNSEEVKEWLDEKIDERRRLYKFLKEEQSLLPDLEANHSVFDTSLFEENAQKRMNEKVKEYVNKESKNNKKFF